MRSTPKSRKLAKKISRKLTVGRSTEFHKEAIDYDRREDARVIKEGLRELAMENLGVKIIPAEWVRVHFQCPECGAKQTIKLSNLMNPTFVCDKCDHLENYMELLGISL